MITTKLQRCLLIFCFVQIISGQGILWGPLQDACEYDTSKGKDHEATKVAIGQGRLNITKSGEGRMGVTKECEDVGNNITKCELIGNMTEDFYMNHAPSTVLRSTKTWDRIRDCRSPEGIENVNARFTTMSDLEHALVTKVRLPPYQIAIANPYTSWFKNYVTKWCCVVVKFRCGDATKCESIAYELVVEDYQCREDMPYPFTCPFNAQTVTACG